MYVYINYWNYYSEIHSSMKLLVERCGCRWLGSIVGEYDLYVCDSFLRRIVQNNSIEVIKPDSWHSEDDMGSRG